MFDPRNKNHDRFHPSIILFIDLNIIDVFPFCIIISSRRKRE